MANLAFCCRAVRLSAVISRGCTTPWAPGGAVSDRSQCPLSDGEERTWKPRLKREKIKVETSTDDVGVVGVPSFDIQGAENSAGRWEPIFMCRGKLTGGPA